MIETDRNPLFCVVAVYASGSGEELRIEGIFMHVAVTVGAYGSDIPEVPFVLFPVTGNAGGGSMSAIKNEFSPAVLFDRIGGVIEPLCRMTV